jgi:hypothetical protein
MTIYPNLDQPFRLKRIAELDSYLVAEADAHRKTQKKYQRVVNVTHGLSTGVRLAGLGLEAVGISMIRPVLPQSPALYWLALVRGRL